MGLNQLFCVVLAVIRFQLKLATKGGFRVGVEDGGIEFAFIINQQGFVVGDKLGK